MNELTPNETPRLTTADGEVHLLVSPCEIGRADECAVVLTDSQVSRRHCILQSDSRGQWWLTDQESTNGTYVNGRRVTQAVLLQNNDAITIGNQQYFFYGSLATQHGAPTSSQVPQGTTINFSQINCWLLVGDIINSTVLSQGNSPQELNKLIGDWGSLSREVIEKHRGEVNKFLGDGYFAFWRESAIDGAGMVQLLQDINALKDVSPLDFRLILHFGAVQLGGVMTRGEENLSGSAVNYVFKSEKVASTLEQTLFISDTAAAKMAGAPLTSLGVHAVPGFPGENAFFTLAL